MRRIRRVPITFDTYLLRNAYASRRPPLLRYAAVMLDNRSATVLGGVTGGASALMGLSMLGSVWPAMLFVAAGAFGLLVIRNLASNATAAFDNSPVEPVAMATLLHEASWLTRNRIGDLMESDPDGIFRHRHLLIEMDAIKTDLSAAAERPQPLPFWTQS